MIKRQRIHILLIFVGIFAIYQIYEYFTPFSQLPENFQSRREWGVSLLHSPKCPNSSKTLTLIKTSPNNFKLRQLARKSAELQKSDAILFLIGRHEEDSRLDAEIEKYDDIIIGDFIDSYYNLTLKTLTGYRFFTQNCNGPKWAIFADDDTFIDQKALEHFQSSELDPYRPYCLFKLHWNVGVIRSRDFLRRIFSHDTWQKYQISENQYSLASYPPYCGGPCSLVSSKFAEIIYNQALVTNPGIFTMEDVFFTGILRVKSNLDAPLTANGICTHFNHHDKELRLVERLASLEG